MTDQKLDEPTLRAVEMKFREEELDYAAEIVEAMLPKPVSWAEATTAAWMSTQDLPSFDNYLDAAKHFAHWLEADHDRWPQPAVDEEALTIADYEESFRDYRRLTKELDDALFGPDGATGPSLCDVLGSVRRECRLRGIPFLTAQPERKPVSEDEIEREVKCIYDRNLLYRDGVRDAIRRGMELSDPDAEKRGMVTVVEWLEGEGWYPSARKITRHFGLGEK